MSIRVDGQTTGNTEGASGVRRTEQAADAARSSRAGLAPASGKDRVEVSADAQLRSAALGAAQDAPDIRQDVVERARQKLAAGELGNDPAALADRLIDDVLKGE